MTQVLFVFFVGGKERPRSSFCDQQKNKKCRGIAAADRRHCEAAAQECRHAQNKKGGPLIVHL